MLKWNGIFKAMALILIHSIVEISMSDRGGQLTMVIHVGTFMPWLQRSKISHTAMKQPWEIVSSTLNKG
jgi:hypothetical protein